MCTLMCTLFAINAKGLEPVSCKSLILLTFFWQFHKHHLHPMQVRYQAAPHTVEHQSIRGTVPFSVNGSSVGTEQIANFKQFAAHQLQTLLRNAPNRQIRPRVLAVFKVHRVLKIVQD